jgi:hypothetical protein
MQLIASDFWLGIEVFTRELLFSLKKKKKKE